MRTYPECFPCFLIQTVRTTSLLGLADEQKYRLLQDVCSYLTGIRTEYPPPRNVVEIYEMIAQTAGTSDPFRKLKAESTTRALELLPRLSTMMEKAPDRLELAVRLAACGNVIDYGVASSYDIERELKQIVDLQFHQWDMDDFISTLDQAEYLLYLGDNAGESVFDIPLIEEIQKKGTRVIYVVRGGPIINDLTMEDAKAAGLHRLCRVVSTGCNAPGIVFDWCGQEFLDLFQKSPLVISKGQGNFETLFMEPGTEQTALFFIFKVKCPVVSQFLDAPLGSMLFMRNRREEVADESSG